MPPSSLQPKAIIFDLLTALLDSWTLWNHAAGSPSRGLEWRKAYLEITYGCGSYQPYEDLVAQSARQVCLGPEAPRYLIEHWNELQPWPETLSVLETLQQKNYKLAVVTNCSSTMGRAAASFFPFDAVLTAEEAGYYKPHVKPYEDVLDKLGVRAMDTLFVAGSAADVPGATGVGMKVVWHNRMGLEAKGDVLPLRTGETLTEALQPWL